MRISDCSSVVVSSDLALPVELLLRETRCGKDVSGAGCAASIAIHQVRAAPFWRIVQSSRKIGIARPRYAANMPPGGASPPMQHGGHPARPEERRVGQVRRTKVRFSGSQAQQKK